MAESCREFTNGINLAGFARTSRDQDANMRNQSLVPKYIVQSPDEWQNPPRVHRLLPDWRERSLTNPIELKAVDLQREYVVIPLQRAIDLETRTGQVVQPLKEPHKAQHDLKPARAGLPYSPGILYDELIGSAERSSGYGNFRQLLFITPPLFIVSGLGLDKVFSALQRPILCYLLAGLVILPGVLSIIRLHPYQYIYYNEIVGGVSGASGRFPLDGGCTSSREAMEFVNRIAEPNARIGYADRFHLVLPYSRDDLELVHVGSTEEAVAKDVDYIYSCSGTRFQELPTAYEVVIDGTALSVVREGPAGD